MPALSSFPKDQIIEMYVSACKQHAKEYDDLANEAASLRSQLAHLVRKIEHRCVDSFCSLCDIEQTDEGVEEQTAGLPHNATDDIRAICGGNIDLEKACGL